MLILAVMLHLWPLQQPALDARCYGSPLRLMTDSLPEGNHQGEISDIWAFLDPKTSKPVAYLYGTYGYDADDAVSHPGTSLQFTTFANKDMRDVPGVNLIGFQKYDPVRLTAQQLALVEQHLLGNGLVLVGCFTGPYFIKQ
jgi:hypothetical protein